MVDNQAEMDRVFDASQQNLIYEKTADTLTPEQGYFEGEQWKFSQRLLDNDEITPKFIIENFPAFMDREMALTNMDKDVVKRIMLYYDIAKIDYMMSKPDFKHNFEELRMIDQARVKTLCKALRSTGGPDRERALITTQIRELRIPNQARQSGGFLGGITRFFGGGRQ